VLHLCPNPARRHPTLPDERTLHDPALSLTAVGLLTRLMNAPADTCTDPRTLATRCGTGRDAIKSALRELGAAGLLLRATARRPDGQLHTLTLVSDDPDILLTELTRLSTHDLIGRNAPSAPTAAADRRPRRPRHARPPADTGEPHHMQEAAQQGQGTDRAPAHSEAAQHGQAYRHCLLRTTNIYIQSYMNRTAAGQHPRATPTSSTQEDR
jgi:hypothetical protein